MSVLLGGVVRVPGRQAGESGGWPHIGRQLFINLFVKKTVLDHHAVETNNVDVVLLARTCCVTEPSRSFRQTIRTPRKVVCVYFIDGTQPWDPQIAGTYSLAQASGCAPVLRWGMSVIVTTF